MYVSYVYVYVCVSSRRVTYVSHNRAKISVVIYDLSVLRYVCMYVCGVIIAVHVCMYVCMYVV